MKTFEKTKDVDPLNTELDEDVKKSLAAKNKNLAVNPDCFVAIIMDYIFENIGIDDDNKGIIKKVKYLKLKETVK